MSQNLSPIVYVADASRSVPEEAVKKYFPIETLIHISSYTAEQKNAFLWSRLILHSAERQFFPDKPLELPFKETYSKNFPNYLTLKDSDFEFCSIDSQGKWIAVALSTLPINVSLEQLNWSPAQIEQGKLFFSQIFIDWIERQNDPQLAFYQLYTANKCLTKRDNPTIKIIIDDDDSLSVLGSLVSLREDIRYWTTDDWICAVQGPSLGTLLSEIRTAEKTLDLLGNE